MNKVHGIAILGFGVVGGGVAKLVTDNAAELEKYTGMVTLRFPFRSDFAARA